MEYVDYTNFNPPEQSQWVQGVAKGKGGKGFVPAPGYFKGKGKGDGKGKGKGGSWGGRGESSQRVGPQVSAPPPPSAPTGSALMSMPSSSLASVNMSTPVGPPPVDRQGGVDHPHVKGGKGGGKGSVKGGLKCIVCMALGLDPYHPPHTCQKNQEAWAKLDQLPPK